MRVRRILFHNPQEELTGQVQGKKASDLEERTARAIDKLGDWGYEFRLRVDPVTGQLGSNFQNILGEVEIDFWCYRNKQIRALFIDGEISHFRTRGQTLEDEAKTEVVNKLLERIHQPEAIRVPYTELITQAAANNYFRELLI